MGSKCMLYTTKRLFLTFLPSLGWFRMKAMELRPCLNALAGTCTRYNWRLRLSPPWLLSEPCRLPTPNTYPFT